MRCRRNHANRGKHHGERGRGNRPNPSPHRSTQYVNVRTRSTQHESIKRHRIRSAARQQHQRPSRQPKRCV